MTEERTPTATSSEVLVRVEDLSVSLTHDGQELKALQHLTFEIHRGETLAVVGESGCGKSMTALALMGLLPQPPAYVSGGAIYLEDVDLTKLSSDEMRSLRGDKLSMIFQEPMTSLNPVMTAGNQIKEALLAHRSLSRAEARDQALEMIRRVGIPAPEKVYKSYPHELSGGMRQRIMIAMALATDPALLICDEPTTALDVTIQAQILQLIDSMKTEFKTGVMLITHDMGVVSEMADWVCVMYAGHLVEYTRSRELFEHPKHPYSEGLIKSIPSLDRECDTLYAIPGNVPALKDLPEGCPFHPRCPHACEVCRQRTPQLQAVSDDTDHLVACWMYDSTVWEDAHVSE